MTQDIANTILTDSNLAIVRQRTVWTIEWFLSEKGQDKDAEVFQNYLNSLKILMESEGKTPPVGS